MVGLELLSETIVQNLTKCKKIGTHVVYGMCIHIRPVGKADN